jgi:hypothetical protein
MRYAPVYYNSYSFNNFVETETPRMRVKGQLIDSLLSKARVYSLPVSESDIIIKTSGSMFRVAVNYRVPVNLFAYHPELKFHVESSGILSE